MKLAVLILSLSLGWLALRIVAHRSDSSIAASEEPLSTYELRGVLQSYDSQTYQATISHEAIAGYMPAMTMSFEIRAPSEFAALQPGDTLAGHLCIKKNKAWIEQVQKISGRASSFSTPIPASLSRELSAGDILPDIEFTDTAGNQLHLHDYRGECLMITFIYTQCPLPTYCPLLSRNFATAQTLLKRLQAGNNWHLLTISLDAEHDTPEILTAYAQSYQADPKQWTFATAREEDLRRLGNALGLTYSRSSGRIDHNLRAVVVDTHGRLQRIFRGNSWTPQELAAESRTALRVP